VEIFPMLPYEQYMETMEEGDFNVDCFPFGGSNTASDAIHLGKPLISMVGTRWFNQIGPSMVENFCGYMGPETVEEYEDEIVAMITYAGFNHPEMTHRRPDAVYEPRGAEEFNEWIKKMVRGIDA
jgi:predicted O-linked N-acetylglucosamine transferase (SPINDLY family)